MGNSLMGRDASCNRAGAPIHTFYSSNAWIEGRAEEQLTQTANLEGVQKIAAFPDLHPGKYGPVGCAVLGSKLYPALVGNDIGCGMALFELDLSPRRIKLHKTEKQLRKIGDPDDTDYAERLEAEGLPFDMWPNALGTIGGGNHFCELQLCRDAADNTLDTNHAFLLVHSGSRGLGNAILMKYLASGVEGINGDDAEAYLEEHDEAVIWAKLNRRVIAERAASALRADVQLIVDNVHNLITREFGGFLHRKGAAIAGGMVPLAGSRSTESYLIDTSLCPENTLASCAHGSGRKFDRRSMHGRVSSKKSSIEALNRNAFGGRVICEDKSLLIEEAPSAYKSSASVLADLEMNGIATLKATLEPLITFKKVREEWRK